MIAWVEKLCQVWQHKKGKRAWKAIYINYYNKLEGFCNCLIGDNGSSTPHKPGYGKTAHIMDEWMTDFFIKSSNGQIQRSLNGILLVSVLSNKGKEPCCTLQQALKTCSISISIITDCPVLFWPSFFARVYIMWMPAFIKILREIASKAYCRLLWYL